MHVRLTHFTLDNQKVEETITTYYAEIAPVIAQQPGIVNVMLLEPVDGSNEFISCSTWKEEADRKAFEASAIYQEVFGKIKAATVMVPFQKYYHVADQ